MHHPRGNRFARLRSPRAFTLIELLVVIAILAVLFVAVLLVLNPAQLLAQSRDADRIQDLATIQSALNYYLEDTAASGKAGSLGAAGTASISVPDPSATSTAGDQCQGLGLPPLPQAPSAWAWGCAQASNYRQVTGTGWVPVNFGSISVGSPISQLPQDPTDTTSSDLYYSFASAGSQYELTAELESTKYVPQMSTDGGAYQGTYQAGDDLNLTPPSRSYGLVGFWPLNEGSGTVAYDYSGNGNSATWYGTKASPSSTYYAAGLTYPNAGYFDGSTDSVTALNNSALQITGPITMSAWVYPKISSNYQTIIIKNGARDYAVYLSPTTTGVYVNIGVSGFGGTIAVSPGWTVSTWNFITVTANGTAIQVYINGALAGSASSTALPTASTGLVYIGENATGNQYYLNGYEADVRVYNRALSATEIAGIYNAEK